MMMDILAKLSDIKSLYCSCTINKDKSFDAKSCNYTPHRPLTKKKKLNVRTTRVEAEHIVPASIFGGMLDEWKNWKNYCKSGGGRKCAESTKNPTVTMKHINGKSESMYNYAAADLFNLRYAVGELNGDRSNSPYTTSFPSNEKTWSYGGCKFRVSKSLAMPIDNFSRGVIARASLYMEWAYSKHLGFKLAPSQRKLFVEWNNKYPPKKEELSYEKWVYKLQRNHNPFIIFYRKLN